MAIRVQRPPIEAEYTRAERVRIVASASIGWGLEFFDLMLVSLLAVELAQAFGVGLDGIGVVLTGQLVATAIGGIIFGRLGDRYGRKRVLTWTIWIFGVGTAACALAPNFWIFLLLRLLTGLGVGGEWAVGFSLLNEAWQPRRRGLAGGFMQSAIWIAYALAILVTSVVDNWRWVFAIGVAPVLAAVWIRYGCPESRQWLALQQSLRAHRDKDTMPWRLLRQHAKLIVVATVVVFGAQYSYYVYSSWMPTYLKHDLGVAPATAQAVLYISAVICFISYVSAGAISDYLGRRRTLIGFGAIQIVGFVAFAVLNIGGRGSIPAVVATYFVISFGLGHFAIFGTWFGELFPTPIRATAASFCYSVGRGIAGFGPALVGSLAATHGLGGGISTGVIAIAVMLAFGAVLQDRRGRTITAQE
jgi:MFS family permease